MTLGQTQEKFSRMIPALLNKAFELGFEVRIGHVLRCDHCPVGKEFSLHKMKLAIDLNLFKDGKFLSGTADHTPLGEYWESLGGSWGGKFNDGNHYSLSFKGMK
jgi:hypothetical protein